MVKEIILEETMSSCDIKTVISSINNSKKQYRQYVEERNLETQNGKYFTEWDNIFTNIKKSFSSYPFKCYKISRCNLWKFIAIYRADINILYLILKEERLKELRKDNNPYHYLRIFNSKNCYLQKERLVQTSLSSEFEAQVVSDEYIDEDLERMIGDIKDDVQCCVNILFKQNSNGVNKISANIVSQDLEIIDTYDWSKYITADIEEVNDTISIEIEENIKPEIIPLNIRPNITKTKDEKAKIVKEKKDEQTKIKNV